LDTPEGRSPATSPRIRRIVAPETVIKADRAPLVGVLVDRLDSEYQSAVVGGVLEAAREIGVNLVCFVGAAIKSPERFGRERNAVYNLATSDGIDGLIILAGTLGNYHGHDDLAAFCERFRPLPMVSIAANLPGMTSILIDGERALRDGIRHLVEDHQYRRIAYLGGPHGNLEARSRLQTYGEMLARYSLRPPDSFIASGDFTYESGVDAVRLLLDERDVSFDAIVVANDNMALGVIDALRARGTRVPRDVAIIGFDDIREARYCAPPLTTIRQPLKAQGKLALEILLRRLRDEQVDDVFTLPTELVVRRSCGCFSDGRRTNTTSNLPPPLTRPGTELGVDAALQLRRTRIVEALREPRLLHGIGDDWQEDLLDALIADLRGQPGGGFAERVNALVERSLAAGGTGQAWQPAFSGLRRELMPCLASDPVMRAHAEDLFQEARTLVGDAVEHTQAEHRLVTERRAGVMAETAEAIGAALNQASLGDVLNEHLPRIGIPSGYIVLYERAQAASARRRLVYAHDPTKPAAVAGDRGFDARSLLPAGVLAEDRQIALVVEPLFVKDDPLGYVVFELGPLDGLIYESLRRQISGVLKVALLIEELVAAGAERADLLADLQVRAGQLEEAYRALQDNQQQLLSAEKMASLGRITANIAHEMNTPLAAVRTALIEIEKRAVEYEASVGDADVTDEDHAQIAAEMRASLQLARSAAERAARFVRGVKTQTRDISAKEKVRFDPAPVIEDALLLLSYDLRRASCQLDFHPPERPIELLGSPGLLAQVVTNLVTNAIDATPEGGGTITIRLSRRDGAACLVVQDTGSGIPPELRDKVFEPMFTTKPFGQGTGLGLAIVHDLVAGQLGGSLELESEVGVGTTFTLTLPLRAGS
jgi:DNA-binding LacI/PurR family transcriptional regulator/signal transduction histidine kinase